MSSTKLLKKSLAMVFSSDPAQGARQIGTNPNSYDAFQVQFDEPIHIPREAVECTLKVDSTVIWNHEANVVAGVNDTLRVTGPNTSDITTVFDIIIPEGSYSVSEFNQTVQTLLANQGAKTSPDTIISITPDEATSKIEIRLNYITSIVDFTQPNSCFNLLGFLNTSVVGPPSIAGEAFLAPNEANFNVINYYLIASDLVSQGLRFNNTYRGIINQTEITSRPGSQIVNTPFNPAVIPCNELIGQVRSNVSFRLLKDDLSPSNTRGEYYSLRLSIDYLLPIKF
jgi:hypothetical protein